MNKAGKWGLYLVGGLLGLLVIIGVVGLFLPSHFSASASVDIHKSPQAVWDVLGNPERTKDWAGAEIQSVEFLQKTAPRRYKFTGTAGSAVYEEIVAEPARRLKTRVVESTMGMGGTWDVRIEPVGGGSRVSVAMQMDLANPWFRVLGSFIDPDEQERKTLLLLKNYVEAL